MRILNITAQKPDSTGSGIYLSELVKELNREGHTQAVIAGVYPEDEILLPPDVERFLYIFIQKSCLLPLPGCPMRCLMKARCIAL